MKILISPASFSFSASAKTLTFSAQIPSAIGSILSVTNVTRGVIYHLPQAGFTGTYVGGVLTLASTTSTTGHADSDSLQILVEDGREGALETGGNLAGIRADLGNDGTSPPTLPGGSTGVRGWLRYLAAALTSIDGKTPAPRTPTTTSVASSATSVTILASNSNRRGLTIFNDSTASLRLSFSTPASQANSFLTMEANSFLLLDNALIVTNTIYGIWTSANGTAQITEMT